MPRIRTIKPEIFSSPQVMNLPVPARLLWFGLITHADDDGIGSGDPRKLKATIFPGDDEIGSGAVLEMCAQIAREKLAIFYDDEAHGRLYFIPTFRRHQVISHPRKSNYPLPTNGAKAASDSQPSQPFQEASSNPPVILPEISRKTPGGLEGSDLKDLKDLTRAREQPLRARAAQDRRREELNGHRDPKAEVLKLASVGMLAGDIVRMLPDLKLKQHDVEYWIRTSSGASA